MSGPNPVYSERSPSSDESAKNQGSAVAYSTSQPQPTTSQSNHDSNDDQYPSQYGQQQYGGQQQQQYDQQQSYYGQQSYDGQQPSPYGSAYDAQQFGSSHYESQQQGSGQYGSGYDNPYGATEGNTESSGDGEEEEFDPSQYANLPRGTRRDTCVGPHGMSGNKKDTGRPKKKKGEFEEEQTAVLKQHNLKAGDIYLVVQKYIMAQRQAAFRQQEGLRLDQNIQKELRESSNAVYNLVRELNFRLLRVFSDAEVRELVEVTRIVIKRQDDWVFQPGDPGDAFYFCLLGDVDIYIPDARKPVDRLSIGDQFGEVDQGSDNKRDYGVKVAAPQAIFGMVEKKVFKKLHARHRQLEVAAVCDFFKDTPPFQFANERVIKWLAKQVKPRMVKKGQYMKDNPHEIVIVQSGRLQLFGDVAVHPHARVWEHMINARVGSAHGFVVPDDSQEFQDIPLQYFDRGYIWGHDRALLDEESRVWADGCEFTEFYFQAKQDTKMAILTLDDLGSMCKREKQMAEWMSEHARINHSSVREICLAILQFVLQIDFRQKFMQYVKKINETLSVHQEHRLSRIEMWVNVLNQRDNKFGKNTEGETEKQRREFAEMNWWRRLIEEHKELPETYLKAMPKEVWQEAARKGIEMPRFKSKKKFNWS